MSAKPFPALCRDCKHSAVDPDRSWDMCCQHPIVNAANPYWLAGPAAKATDGLSCRETRGDVGWFAKCGLRGKLWEPKP